MCASFRWEETEDSEKWLPDGTSASRKKNGNGSKKRFWGPGKITGFALLLMLAGFLAFGFTYQMEDSVSATGVVEPLESAFIKAPLKGTIQELHAQEGDYVQKGQVLLQLYPDDITIMEEVENKALEVQSLQKDCEKAEESINVLKNELAKTRNEKESVEKDDSEEKSCNARIHAARVELAQKQTDCKREEDLFAKGLVSKRDFERSRVARDIAKARLDAAQAELQSIVSKKKLSLENLEKQIEILTKKAKVAELELAQKREELSQKKLQLASAKERRERLCIKAPVSGMIVRLDPKLHDHVEPGEVIMVLTDSADLKLKMSVPVKGAFKIKVGQPVRIFSRTYSSMVYGHASGSVIEKWKYTRKAPGSSEALTVFATIDGSPFPLELGSTVDATIVVGKRRLLFPPILGEKETYLARVNGAHE